MIVIPDGQDPLVPFPGFDFYVSFRTTAIPYVFGGMPNVDDTISGGFSEITGLEATMEPKVIKEGGRNYGPVQRAGPVSFSTVVLKRGVVRSRHLWGWWAMFAGSDDSKNGGWSPNGRADVDILLIASGQAVLGWHLVNAMPVKFRAPDFNARGAEVAIEELHLVHEGLNTAPVS
jgi:phage tail-like protein